MRSVTSAALVALALAGCGDYSTEDLRFLAALPKRSDLKVEVPAAAAAVAKGTAGAAAITAACPGGAAEIWEWAKPTSDNLNAGVDVVVGLIDVVRRYPPSWRGEDARAWGPFDDENHPGRELLIGIARTYPAELGGAPRHVYAFQARVKGTPDFTTIIYGTFEGGSAEHGRGALGLDFDAVRALGMEDATTPVGTMWIGYDRTADPVKLQLYLDQSAFGNEAFYYQFAGWASGNGVFDYAFRDASANTLVVRTRYLAGGEGRAGVAFVPAGGGANGAFEQCWDAGACLVYVNDPGNYSCPAADWPCSMGAEGACAPNLPVSPFPP